MPAEPPDVTPAPLIDTVCGDVAIQFDVSGASVRVDAAGNVTLVITDIKPTAREIETAGRILRAAGETVRAVGLEKWAEAA